MHVVDKQSDEYELKGPDENAKGVLTKDGFLVKAGSSIPRDPRQFFAGAILEQITC